MRVCNVRPDPAPPDAREPDVAHQTSRGDARQTASIQVQGSDKPPVTGKR